ncbi:MAG TPA: hypothetical protein VND62_09685 [Acidimicrobiales bacterium]|nr:hypothetical protein [Acidimicrobiales bacterium]
MPGVESGLEPVLVARIEEEREAEELPVHMEQLGPAGAAFATALERLAGPHPGAPHRPPGNRIATPPARQPHRRPVRVVHRPGPRPSGLTRGAPARTPSVPSPACARS